MPLPLPVGAAALSKQAVVNKPSAKFQQLLDQLLLCHVQELQQSQPRQPCGEDAVLHNENGQREEEHETQLSGLKAAVLHDGKNWQRKQDAVLHDGKNGQREQVDVQTAFPEARSPSVRSDQTPEQPLPCVTPDFFEPSSSNAELRNGAQCQLENMHEELEFDCLDHGGQPPVMDNVERELDDTDSLRSKEHGENESYDSKEELSRQHSPESQRSRLDFEPRELWTHDYRSKKTHTTISSNIWKSDSSIYDAAEGHNEALNARRPDHADDHNASLIERYLMAAPGSSLRIQWEMFAGILIAYDLIKIPLGVYQPTQTLFTDIVDVLSLVFWTCNILASMTVGYMEDGQLVKDPQRVLTRYLKGWFVLDLIAVAPDWIFLLLENVGTDTESFKLLRVLRLMKFVRLLRILRLRMILTALSDFLDSEYMDIVISLSAEVSLLFCVNHIAACIWYAISPVSTPGPTWTKEPDMLGRSWEYMYCTALHWSVTQFTPASMSVQPTNLAERSFAVCIVFFGLIFFSYIVGSITASLSRLRQMSTETAKELWLLRRFLKRNTVPRALSRRILSFIEHAHKQQQEKMCMDQVKVLKFLSGQLMAELQCALNLPHLQVHPLFHYLSEHAIVTMHTIAKDAVSRIQLAREDTLFLPDQRAQAMYFVKSGRVLYTKVLKGEQTSELVDADEDWIAEGILWTPNWVHVGEARAYTEVELVKVSPKPFEEILRLVRPVANLVSHYARNFLEWLETQELSDVIQGDQLSDEIMGFIPGDVNELSEWRTSSTSTSRGSIFNGLFKEELQAL
eukprot:TRINITY_DN31256_c0_g1_i1.p1 TRINITY_DN31256_c0_g1~~TRINITY_DN31256_c0_g1_i1.p1  ORF type:complete len:796 (-),score=98.06 TRINITY_DN31256_c0_g1_i1:99-2486(-)